MQRTTITLDDELAEELDAYMAQSGAANRSEAIRDLIRSGLAQRPDAPSDARCYGVVSCAVDLSVRNLAARVPQSRLDRHDQTVAALSVPLDHSTTLEVAVMKGRVVDVASYADALFLERGVMHGSIGLVPVTESEVRHVHNEGEPHSHTHTKVQSTF
ncbi:nickel-responsive transcriptional regulator NikR [Marivivens aquimaris]|uniref:nickel-responsive transcriptional regulator NikR n=1 Tax=Marivivens aquimaris TaxID=2774876 RepID=UPI00187E9864|nr:nickel-responsive transcriptional regulator NikR [Marivivens aquimaris]